MLRLLLQAGLGAATFNIGRRIADLKRSVGFFAVAGVIGLLGLGALTAAAAIALEPKLGAAGAAAAVGGGLVVVAGLIGWAGAWKPRPKAPAPIFERVRAEVGAAGAAMAASRAKASRRARAAADEISEELPPAPLTPEKRRKKALNLMLIATIAGVVLGRRL